MKPSKLYELVVLILAEIKLSFSQINLFSIHATFSEKANSDLIL